MSNQTQTQTQLTSHIERARKVLYYEQRGNHQDKIVRGGLELFAVRWADDVSSICKSAGLDLKPIHRFTEHLESYRQQDPMQRAASLRAALAILNATDGPTPGTAVTSALKSVRDAWLVDMPASRWMGSSPGRAVAGRLGAGRLPGASVSKPGRPPGAPVPYDGPWFSV